MQYEIKGGAFPVVICQLNDGEQMITEKGSMVWMSPNMEMKTSGGGVGKMFSKAFSGESMFQNIYTARGGNALIAFGSSFPGQILALEIGPGNEIILQKAAFLASEPGGTLSAQTADSTQTSPWTKEGFAGLKLTQVSLTNWAAGGDNSVAFDLQGTYQINYKKEKHLWTNRLDRKSVV